VRWFYEQEVRDGATPGFVGSAARAFHDDFVPRFSAFFDMLLAGRGPREMALKLNAIRPCPETPGMVLRGVLQSRLTFIVPPGVEIAGVEEHVAGAFSVVVGSGSDGVAYHSTEVFAQDEPGDIVQVAAVPRTLYGLDRDGRLWAVGEHTRGAMEESALTRDPERRFVFMAVADDGLGARLFLVGADGQVYARSQTAERLARARFQPPDGLRLVAIGEDADDDGRIVAADAGGGWHAWSPRDRRFVPLETPPVLARATPSLLGHGVPGVLWAPADGGRR
jgi:hypothetical protein